MSFGLNCGYALNPVRDFIPRLFTSIAGWVNLFLSMRIFEISYIFKLFYTIGC